MASDFEESVDHTTSLNNLRPNIFPLGGKASSLIIGESNSLALQLFAENPILLAKIGDHILLLSIHPPSQRHHNQLPRLKHHNRHSTIPNTSIAGQSSPKFP
jgi:hypothetical protein